ncbi:MAG: family 78 glycoside hydrolase catalytic domain [Opitutaceae bacterium]|nr:family 78 glycoside hydrolase catalytic domain [Opitutaceae bacterium]
MTDDTCNWGEAQWIAFEAIQSDMKVVPGIHGFGDHLDGTYLKRSVVPMFRKTFDISKTIESASISICGLGHYECYLNGMKAGDSFLSPGWSNYEMRCFYNSHDITPHLTKGSNTIGILVGNGFYNINNERYRKLIIAYGYPKLIFKIQLKFSEGSISNIVSDSSCRVAPSPIIFSSIFGGEDYDATLEQEGWMTAPFDDSHWHSSIVLKDSLETLEPEKDHPLKVMQEFLPQKISVSKTGKQIYDFGQNASGIISLKAKGNKGTRIRIRPDELINSEGDVTQLSGGGPYELNYTLKGKGIEVWQPRFSYYGFRYADVEIIEPKEALKKSEVLELKMLHTRNSSPTVGSFSCSDTLINRIFDLINWGIKSNMASIATDCPHREKLGWLEQTYLIGPSMHFNFDIQALYSKIVTDMIDSQLDDGLVPDVAPEYVPFTEGFRDSPEWGSASIIIPWQLYRWYGNQKTLKKAYPMMRRYIDYLHEKSKNHILDYGLGDWYDLGPEHPGEAQLTPKAVTATSIYYHDLQIISKAAKLMDYPDDSEKYQNLSNAVKKAFLKNYYNPQTGVCSTGSQTAYAMPLYVGLIPEEDKEKVLRNLIESIKSSDYVLTSGDVGYHFLVRVLSENGRSDILYKMNNRSDRPGYSYQLDKGATALTESWEALTDVSNNHMMLGHLMEWFYTGLGGISQTSHSVAYNDLILAPNPVEGIHWVKCSYQSFKGKISSEWIIEEDALSFRFEIPEGASANIIIPADYRKSPCEVIDLTNQKILSIEIQNGAFRVKPGIYKLTAKRE